MVKSCFEIFWNDVRHFINKLSMLSETVKVVYLVKKNTGKAKFPRKGSYLERKSIGYRFKKF